MKKSDVETIILQEDEIKSLRKRVKALESGNRELCRINDQLRKKLERNENTLAGVNV